MTFVLPRTAAKLSFLPTAASPPRAQRRPPPLPTRPRDVYCDEVATPYMGSRPHVPAARPHLDSYGDEAIATLAMAREPAASARAPLPAFRVRNAASDAGPALVLPPASSRDRRAERSPTMRAFWILTAIFTAMVAYKYAPELFERLSDAVKLLG